jgi:hypothetical protein
MQAQNRAGSRTGSVNPGPSRFAAPERETGIEGHFILYKLSNPAAKKNEPRLSTYNRYFVSVRQPKNQTGMTRATPPGARSIAL